MSTALCAITNVTLNFILIPVMIYNGAAIATLLTRMVFSLSAFYFVSRGLQLIPIHNMLAKPIISGLLMGIFVYYFIDVNIFVSSFRCTDIFSDTARFENFFWGGYGHY